MSQTIASELLLFTPESSTEMLEQDVPSTFLVDLVPEGVAGGIEGLTHGQVVERIMRMNNSATLEFLAPFTTPMLRDYMDHLVTSLEPRGRNSRWARRADSPAILSSESSL